MASQPFQKPSAGLRKFALSFSAFALALLILWYFVADAELPHFIMSEAAKHISFEIVPGIFEQSEPGTVADGYDYTKNNFGLIDRPYPSDNEDDANNQAPWQRLALYVDYLNANSPESISYKVLYMGRHGEGDHNVAEAYYGTASWDDHWSLLEGNGTVTWADAHLTPTGKQQALDAHAFISAQLTAAQMPAPQVYIVSPLYRCLQTAQLTFTDLTLPADRPFTPTIKERLREVLGEHTCDRRSTRTAIAAGFPDWPFEAGFTEDDELWLPHHRETHVEHDLRTREFLTDLFTPPNGLGVGPTFVSLTSHSGAIASHLRVLGHREFALPTGGMIPVLIKVTTGTGSS